MEFVKHRYMRLTRSANKMSSGQTLVKKVGLHSD